MQVIEPFGTPLRITNFKLSHDEIDADMLAGNGAALPQPAAMLRKSALLQVGGYRHDYPYSEDVDLFLRLAEVGQLANLPDVLVKYRLHNGSANWQHWQKQLENKPLMLAETYRRRGQPVPEIPTFTNYWDREPADRYVNWVWLALKDRNLPAARKHAYSALRLAPFRQSTWRAAFCAMRGY